jgi:hypothetical protein
MKRFCLVVLALLLPAANAVEPPVAHLSDSSHLLPGGAEAAAMLEAKLQAFEKSSGIRIVVEFHPKSPAPDEDKAPGDYMRALSSRLGLIKRGVVAVYFADDPDWRLWIGDELTPVFVGKPGTAKAFTENDEMHNAKEAFFKATWAEADAALARHSPSSPATPSEKAAAQTAALIDGLIRKLAPTVEPKRRAEGVHRAEGIGTSIVVF